MWCLAERRPPPHIFFSLFFLISSQKVRSQTVSLTWWTCELSRPPAGRLSLRWVLAPLSCCDLKCWSLWFWFWVFFVVVVVLLLHLTLVMKSGLLCFSHYLFIKDMTRKWELPWRQLHKVSELYAELHCLLFCQESGAEWGARGVFFSFFFFFLLGLSLVPSSLCFLCGSNNDQSAVVIFRIVQLPLKWVISLRLKKRKWWLTLPHWGEKFPKKVIDRL